MIIELGKVTDETKHPVQPIAPDSELYTGSLGG